MSVYEPQQFPYESLLPHEPCTRCGKGDSTHIVASKGDPTWLAGALMIVAETTGEEASAMVEDVWHELLPTDAERRSMCIRLCLDCAADIARRMPGLPTYTTSALHDGVELHGLAQPS